MSRTLANLGDDLNRLRAATGSTMGDAVTRQGAANRFAEMQRVLDGHVKRIETAQAEVEFLQTRLKKINQSLKDSPPDGRSGADTREHQKAQLEEQIRRKLTCSGFKFVVVDGVKQKVELPGEIDLLMERAKQDERTLLPKLKWAERVMNGMSEADADRLGDLEAADAARAQPEPMPELEVETISGEQS